MEKLLITIQSKARNCARRMADTLHNETGDGHLETVIKVILGIVIAALILGFLYAALQNNWLPGLGTKVDDLIGYSG